MLYIKINSDGSVKYPYYLWQLREDYPNTSFPEPYYKYVNLSDYSIFTVLSVSPPEYNPTTQKAVELNPVIENDQYKQTWTIENLTQEEILQVGNTIKSEVISSTQQRLDNFAKTRYYDGILSLCTYATSTNTKFSVEGQYGVEVRDATWAKLYEILAEVEAGMRPMPSGYAAIESELPVLRWPN